MCDRMKQNKTLFFVRETRTKNFLFSCPIVCRIYSDAAYTDYKIENNMKQVEEVELKIAHRSNAKREDEAWMRISRNK